MAGSGSASTAQDVTDRKGITRQRYSDGVSFAHIISDLDSSEGGNIVSTAALANRAASVFGRSISTVKWKNVTDFVRSPYVYFAVLNTVCITVCNTYMYLTYLLRLVILNETARNKSGGGGEFE